MKLFFLALFMWSGLNANQIIHERIDSTSFGLPLTIDAFIDKEHGEIHRFTLLVRPYGNTEYQEFPLIYKGSYRYAGIIPGNYLEREYIEYYLMLELADYNRVTFPKLNAKINPLKISVIPNGISGKKTESLEEDYDIVALSPEAIILSPDPESSVNRKDVFIALSYFSLEEIDPSKIQVFLDEKDMTPFAYIDSTYLSLQHENITPGNHKVRVHLTNIYGQKFDDIVWNFKVTPSKGAGIGIIKNQSRSMRVGFQSRSTDYVSQNVGSANLQYFIDLEWLKIDVDYYKSSLENQYDQPFDRYKIKFASEFLEVNFGDSHPYFDEYSLRGHPVRGLHFIFSRGPVYGELINGVSARAVQGDPAKNAMEISHVDSTSNNWIYYLSRNNYNFKRDVWGGNLILSLGNKIKWGINFLKVQDNTQTVSAAVNNARVYFSSPLQNRMVAGSDNFLIEDLQGTFTSYSDLLEGFNNIFPDGDSLVVLTSNFIGDKPKGNYIWGSSIQLGFDKSRIQYTTGFSYSMLNQNRWNNITSVSQLDTVAFDTTIDGKYLDHVTLDSTVTLSQYESNFYFGSEMMPMIPYVISSGSGLSNLLNSTSVIRHSTLQLRYLKNRIEIGNKQIGGDYYSLLNPGLKTNYSERFISDRINLFQNKLLLFYKNSKITEGIYAQISKPVKTNTSLLNIALFPGSGLPSFNFSFQNSTRSNDLKTLNYISDSLSIMNGNSVLDTIGVDTVDQRVNLLTNQFNISMTNHFQLGGDQVLSVNILNYSQTDNIGKERTQSPDYFIRDAESESYGISLKTVYNKYWESSIYLSLSSYNFGRKGSQHYMKQEHQSWIINLFQNTQGIFNKVSYGVGYFTGRNNHYFTQYNLKWGFSKQYLDLLNFSGQMEYRIKYLGAEIKSANDYFITMNISYDLK
ncbi:MAG: hypothetical protein QGF36_05335 [Candidatus Marinimicrobia bacterium]|nr:hypothetical protein [Candidatus Neomarinimicrobiota bacterium]